MADTANPLDAPTPTKEPGQLAISLKDLYFTRWIPPWSRPPSLPAANWRAWVLNQPVALVCRETLIANLLALDWKIVPRNSDDQDELSATIKYYTKLIERGGNYPELGLDYTGLLEWVIGDLLDLPFGSAMEIGRKSDSPQGRVVWLKPLDGGTLYPTLNADFPVVQYYSIYNVVSFPQHAIARTYLSPQQFILREGWGMAPPEKIYFAISLLNRGDLYYANLLLDTPSAGILDLGDMEKSSAMEWMDAFHTFIGNSPTPLKIPVLYEHNNKIEFIPFGKVPNDIMFDKVTLKYAALVASAYGMSLSDIGLQTTSASGETLAGSIRQERRTRKTGFARVKLKWKYLIDSFLPDSLEFKLIDQDDELNVGLGRARLATATAFGQLLDKGVVSPQEVRSQVVADGLMSISMPETIPPDAKPLIEPGSSPERPGALGKGVSPSSGGEGEVKSLVFSSKSKVVEDFIHDIAAQMGPKLNGYLSEIQEDDIPLFRSFVGDSLFDEVDDLELQILLKSILPKRPLGKFEMKGLEEEVQEIHGVSLKPYIKEIQDELRIGINEYLGKAIAFNLKDVILHEDAFDTRDTFNYDYVVDKVQNRVLAVLKEFALSFANDVILRKVEQIKQEQKSG